MLSNALLPYRYCWPTENLEESKHWRIGGDSRFLVREMPEDPADLARDSRWPAFFPAPLCIVTTADGTVTAMEREVGASIVNRFPYVMGLSFCREPLSARHHPRRKFAEIFERGGVAAVQFLPPGPELDRILATIDAVPDGECETRIEKTGLATRPGISGGAPIFESAYMVYETRLVQETKDFQGRAIYKEPWIDCGSHRVYFLEINAILLREDIAKGRSQIAWRSLPAWHPRPEDQGVSFCERNELNVDGVYQKVFTPHYRFPAANTIAFHYDGIVGNWAVKHLPPLPKDQVEVDNDRARWPCFFPSSLGIVTCWAAEGVPNLMPCGSVTIVSRHPLTVAACVSYAVINARYAPRASFDFIRSAGRFGCGISHIDDRIVQAIKYTGNVSHASDPDKVRNAGIRIGGNAWSPLMPALPVHFDCQVAGEVNLGTHMMFLGEVRQISVRRDVTPANPLEWCPWADVIPVE